MSERFGSDVLDVDRLDQVAAQAMAGRTVDLVDVQRRNSLRRRHTRARMAGWGLAAAAAALVIGALTPAGGRLLSGSDPAIPASRLTGPGALPRTIYEVPPWVPTLDEAPMARAALVVETDISTRTWGGSSSLATSPVLVSADGSSYAALPSREASAVSLSNDGTQVAWTPHDRTGGGPPPGREAADVVYMATAGGPHHRVDVADGRPALVEGTAWSPDGRWIAVSGSWEDPAYGGEQGSMQRGLSVIDTESGQAHFVCRCTGSLGFAGSKLGIWSQDDRAQIDLPPGLLAQRLTTDNFAPGLTRLGEGETSLSVVNLDEADYGRPGDFTLVKSTGGQQLTTALTSALGRLESVTLLAWDGRDTAWIAVSNSADAPANTPAQNPQSDQATRRMAIWRVGLASGPAGGIPGPGTVTTTELITGNTGPLRDVDSVARNVALGGQTADVAAPRWPWYEPARLRYTAANLRWALFGIAILAVTALVLLRSRRRAGR